MKIGEKVEKHDLSVFFLMKINDLIGEKKTYYKGKLQ